MEVPPANAWAAGTDVSEHDHTQVIGPGGIQFSNSLPGIGTELYGQPRF